MADNQINQSPEMMGNRSSSRMSDNSDSADSIRRGGGEDPRRYEAQILIDRVVTDNDMSGYNHNATSSQPANNGRENEMRMAQMDKKSAGMGTPNSDGTYSS
jgi:hypothetical protein